MAIDMMTIRFGCSVRLPSEGRFLFADDFRADPELFLKRWIEGAVSNIYEGPQRELRGHDGHIINRPVVRVKYLSK